jgi:hypothetical protein
MTLHLGSLTAEEGEPFSIEEALACDMEQLERAADFFVQLMDDRWRSHSAKISFPPLPDRTSGPSPQS